MTMEAVWVALPRMINLQFPFESVQDHLMDASPNKTNASDRTTTSRQDSETKAQKVQETTTELSQDLIALQSLFHSEAKNRFLRDAPNWMRDPNSDQMPFENQKLETQSDSTFKYAEKAYLSQNPFDVENTLGDLKSLMKSPHRPNEDRGLEENLHGQTTLSSSIGKCSIPLVSDHPGIILFNNRIQSINYQLRFRKPKFFRLSLLVIPNFLFQSHSIEMLSNQHSSRILYLTHSS